MSNSTQQFKAQQRRDKFADLLREMFQLNQPELDFGLYRIMHARKDDINRFIEQDLPRITQSAFSQFASQDKTQLEQALEQARKAAIDAGFNPDESPKVQQLQDQLKDNFDLAREEGEVYDALVTFFNRYYSEGDFLSRRVYKDGTYAIPYQGEEVVLHWANKDQYYIKSSETLRDYSFRLNPNAMGSDNPMRVHFKLIDADAGAQDNNKENADSKRLFVLDSDQPFELIDGEANENGERYTELQLRFCFRAATNADWIDSVKQKATAAAQKKAPTQDHLRNIAIEQVFADQSELPDEWQQALRQPYRKADGTLADYSLLQGQLNNYTKKNSFDYFIHKDLGAFLTRELDFYIKNELLDWEDIAALKNDPARLAPLLSKVEVIRTLGEKIIKFLAQLENFQKKLWLKKKFVTETNYCITLDRLVEHPHLLGEVFDNPKQREDWQSLYKLDLEQLAGHRHSSSLEILLEQPKYRYLMLDTRHFDESFKARLLATIDDLDESCDGLLVHSENFQALNLLQERYKEQVKCIYIDPPYNASATEIIYKNGYKSSSWCTLIDNRVSCAKDLLKDTGVLCATIDDYELHNLQKVMDIIFSAENSLATTVIRNNPSGRSTVSGFAVCHEYALFYSANAEKCIVGRLPHTEEQKSRYDECDDEGKPFEWENLRKSSAGSFRSDRPKQFFPFYYDVANKQLRVSDAYWNESHKVWEISEAPRDVEIVILPKDSGGRERVWNFGIDRARAEISEMRVELKGEKPEIYKKKYLQQSGVLPRTWWDKPEYSARDNGTRALGNLFSGQKIFDFPKAVDAVKDSLIIGALSQKETVLDFFAGSGTTGDAVINLNREDNGQRKYILAEMGDYFNTVLKPRIQKVAYSENWKSGAPIENKDGDLNGLSHCFKTIRLESYEDTLGNLALKRATGQQQLLDTPENSPLSEAREAYVMNYMLEVETRASQSLLNTQQFLDPTRYELKVRSAGGDESRAINVDLLETFNYLLGLKVEHIAAPLHFDAELSQAEYGRWQATVKRSEQGQWWFRTVFGTNRSGQKVLVVWRNLPSVIDTTENGLQRDNAVLDAVLIEKLAIRLTESLDDEVDILYVNGDHNIAIPRNRRGEPMEQARLQLIEEAFHRLMFADTGAVH